MSDHFKISKRKALALAHRSCRTSENKSTIYEHQAMTKNKKNSFSIPHWIGKTQIYSPLLYLAQNSQPHNMQ